MENFVLTIHLVIALALILAVLLQRSEGGGLGIGGGGGGTMSGRPPTTAMAKLTWGLAVAFAITLLTLTWISTRANVDSSVIDRVGTGDAEETEDLGGGLTLPPALEGDLTPPSPADGPAVPPSND